MAPIAHTHSFPSLLSLPSGRAPTNFLRHLRPKMAESVEEVDALTELLRNASYEPAKRELAAVEAFAREQTFI